jgi:hypothetical protein
MKLRCRWLRLQLDPTHWPPKVFGCKAHRAGVREAMEAVLVRGSSVVGRHQCLLPATPPSPRLFACRSCAWCTRPQTSLWSSFLGADHKRGAMHCLRMHVALRSALDDMAAKYRVRESGPPAEMLEQEWKSARCRLREIEAAVSGLVQVRAEGGAILCTCLCFCAHVCAPSIGFCASAASNCLLSLASCVVQKVYKTWAHPAFDVMKACYSAMATSAGVPESMRKVVAACLEELNMERGPAPNAVVEACPAPLPTVVRPADPAANTGPLICQVGDVAQSKGSTRELDVFDKSAMKSYGLGTRATSPVHVQVL